MNRDMTSMYRKIWIIVVIIQYNLIFTHFAIHFFHTWQIGYVNLCLFRKRDRRGVIQKVFFYLTEDKCVENECV